MAKRESYENKWVWLKPEKAAILKAYNGVSTDLPMWCVRDENDVLELLAPGFPRTFLMPASAFLLGEPEWEPGQDFSPPPPLTTAEAIGPLTTTLQRLLLGVSTGQAQ